MMVMTTIIHESLVDVQISFTVIQYSQTETAPRALGLSDQISSDKNTPYYQV